MSFIPICAPPKDGKAAKLLTSGPKGSNMSKAPRPRRQNPDKFMLSIKCIHSEIITAEQSVWTGPWACKIFILFSHCLEAERPTVSGLNAKVTNFI